MTSQAWLDAIAAVMPRAQRTGWLVHASDPVAQAPTPHRPLDPTHPTIRSFAHHRQDRHLVLQMVRENPT